MGTEKSETKIIKGYIAGSMAKYPQKRIIVEKLAKDKKAKAKISFDMMEEDGKLKIIAFDTQSGQPIGYVSKILTKDVTKEDILRVVEEETKKNIKAQIVACAFDEPFMPNRIGFVVEVMLLEKKQEEIFEKNPVEVILEKGILSKKEIEERATYLEKNKVNKEIVKKVFERIAKTDYTEDVKNRIKKPTSFYLDNDGDVASVLTYIFSKENLLFEGERGSGKNTLVDTLSWLLHQPLYEISINGGTDTLDLFGGLGTTLVDGKVVTTFEPSPFIQAMENGGIIVLDEVNAAENDVLKVLNSSLDYRERVEVPNYKKVEAHENFFAIGTLNLGYQGTKGEDPAFDDRFTRIVFDQGLSFTEIIREKFPSMTEDTLVVLNNVYQAMQENINNDILPSSVLTIRGFEATCKSIRLGIPLKRALIDCVANRNSYPEAREVIKQIIQNILG